MDFRFPYPGRNGLAAPNTGRKEPEDCHEPTVMFRRACTAESPVGPV